MECGKNNMAGGLAVNFCLGMQRKAAQHWNCISALGCEAMIKDHFLCDSSAPAVEHKSFVQHSVNQRAVVNLLPPALFVFGFKAFGGFPLKSPQKGHPQRKRRPVILAPGVLLQEKDRCCTCRMGVAALGENVAARARLAVSCMRR